MYTNGAVAAFANLIKLIVSPIVCLFCLMLKLRIFRMTSDYALDILSFDYLGEKMTRLSAYIQLGSS